MAVRRGPCTRHCTRRRYAPGRPGALTLTLTLTLTRTRTRTLTLTRPVHVVAASATVGRPLLRALQRHLKHEAPLAVAALEH